MSGERKNFTPPQWLSEELPGWVRLDALYRALNDAYHPQNPILDHPADFVERWASESGHWASAPCIDMDLAIESAHAAYHEHNETCGCRTVGHLTEHIARSVVAAFAPMAAGPEAAVSRSLTEGCSASSPPDGGAGTG